MGSGLSYVSYSWRNHARKTARVGNDGVISVHYLFGSWWRHHMGTVFGYLCLAVYLVRVDLNHHGPVSVFDNTSYYNVSPHLETARFYFRIVWSHWNLTGSSLILLPIGLSMSKAMQWFKLTISLLRDFTRSYDKTSYQILKGQSIGISAFQLSNPELFGWLWYKSISKS